ncbi:MAG: hypothetical protein ACOCUR_02490 [Nanoarchaeota archaeon]
MRILITILAVFVSLPLALAIESHEITYTIEDDVIKANHLIEIENRTKMEIQLPEDSYYFTVLVDGKNTNYSLIQAEGYKILNIPLEEERNIEISYQTAAFLEKGEHSYFSGYVIPAKTDILSMHLILPEHALLARHVDSLNPPIIPKPSSVESNGRQIIITWKETEPSGAFSIFVAYEEKDSYSWTLLLWIFLITLGIIGFFYQKKYIKTKSRRKKKLQSRKAKEYEPKDDRGGEILEEKDTLEKKRKKLIMKSWMLLSLH